MDLRVNEGNYLVLGTTTAKNQITFTFEAEKEDVCRIIFISKVTQEKESVLVPDEYCLGSLRSVTITGVNPQEYNYLYEINGREQIDSYARVIAGREVWNDAEREVNGNQLSAGFLTDKFSWGEDRQPEIAKEQMVMYKLHVRGFSMADKSAGKNKGTFEAVRNRIPYLKDLGITTLELMPVYEFEEMSFLKQVSKLPEYVKWKVNKTDIIKPEISLKKKRINYWGYGEGNYFAVKASYASKPHKASGEFKKLVKSLHENNMECVMEIFFAEGSSHSLILDVLRYWVKEYHVDGFHIMGANLPMMTITQDALLGRTKIFAEDFGGARNARSYKNLYVYKTEYQHPARGLLNHYECDIREFANQQRKLGKAYGYVNYIATHNGFTLADLFMYHDKHNEENGEGNCDGSNYNLSNNYGVEGPTKKEYINEIRRQRLRSAYMMLLFAQGIPLIQAGDEFGNTQSGNNNAYCQDNETGWVNWSRFTQAAKERELLRKLISFRRENAAFCDENAWISQLDQGRKNVGILYRGDVFVGYNFYSEEVRLTLPKLSVNTSDKKSWYLVMDSSLEQVILEEEQLLEEQKYVTLRPHSICLLKGV